MKVNIVDATLREGKQSLQRTLSNKEILNLAEKIISLGVDQLEVGHASISKNEVRVLRAIKSNFPDTPLMTHSRAFVHDVTQAIEANVDWIGIFISTNDYARFRITNFSVEKAIECVSKSIELAKANNLKVRFTIEDSSRTDPDLLLRMYRNAIRLGADRICLADTLGILEPKDVEKTIRLLKANYANIPLEVHFHNDRGLAMANTLQAIESGAEWISTSVNGIGERSGITDTCLLLANLHYKKIRPLTGKINLKEVSDFVAHITQLPIDAHRPVVGKKAFLHVADLHVKAMKKNKASYNWINPEVLGQQTECIQKLPPIKPSDLVCKPQLTSDIILRHINNNRDNKYAMFDKTQMPDIAINCEIETIPFVFNPEKQFKFLSPQNKDAYIIFAGKAEHLEGLSCEIMLDGEVFLLESPFSVFVPYGVECGYRILSGAGICIRNNVMNEYNAHSIKKPEVIRINTAD